jgi:pantoate kinase
LDESVWLTGSRGCGFAVDGDVECKFPVVVANSTESLRANTRVLDSPSTSLLEKRGEEKGEER